MADDPKQPSPGFTTKKHVDESWKDTASKEKETLSSEEPGKPLFFEPTFPFFITTLGMQAFAALGEVPDPEKPDAPKPPVDLPRAQYLIDIIDMLSKKTKGNLTQEEAGMLEGLLYELRLKFVEKSKP
jgi:hypothetical protein